MNTDTFKDNIGGLLNIFAIPLNAVNDIDYNVDGTCRVVLTSTDAIIKIPVLQDSSYYLDIATVNSSQGDAWQSTIEGIIPCIDNDNKYILDKLTIGYWYIIAIDQNDIPYLCGYDENLMKFSYKFNTGKKLSELNAATFTFDNVQSVPPYIVADINL